MSQAILRCKLVVSSVLLNKNSKGEIDQEQVKLNAVYASDGENAQWSKWTPNASFDIYINNPDAIGKLSAGHEYYVDFIPCVKSADNNDNNDSNDVSDK